MRTHRLGGLRLASPVLLCVLSLAAAVPAGQPARLAPARRAALLLVELPSGRTIAAERPDLLRTPVLPGSLAKIATLLAALESGVIDANTRIACRRQIEVDHQRVTCSHPDLRRPLGAAEALAHSCNGFFAEVASRIPRQALDRGFLELGLPPSSPRASIVSAALGLDGTRVSPEQVLFAFVRLTGAASARMPDHVRRVVLDGLRGAAEYGTASAFHDLGLTALAKTGTAPMPGGGIEGLAVAVWPADTPTRAIVVMAPGAAGTAAAQIAAERIAGERTARRTAQPTPRERRPAVSGLPNAMAGGDGLATVSVGSPRASGGYDVATLPVEEYVARVVMGEAAPGSGIEARKALAIVARTYAAANRGRHAREGFDLCDLTHCQALGPWSGLGEEAARATAGRVLVSGGAVAQVFYTAACGGRSERPSAVWPGATDPPYLVSRVEPECQTASAWVSDMTATDAQRALRAAGLRGGQLRGLTVVERSASGRATRLKADGFDPAELRGEDFRLAVGRVLGWQVLKSALFDIERIGIGYRFRGSGRGHGVGLCVVGSARLAARGETADAIINTYFPGAEIGPFGGRTGIGRRAVHVEVVLPAGEEAERSRVGALAAAALDEMSRRMDLAVPPSVRVVFHTTVAAYQRATGQAWWTAGVTRGSRVDLIPPAALRQRGLLERTIRHELAHVITESRLAGRPRWAREAVAMYAAGELGPDDGRPRPATGAVRDCPSDAEWNALRSAEAAARAYRQAAACFAAQRAAGRRWDEVR